MARLDQKVAIVTGGASGLGFGIAQRYHEEGAITVISDIDPEGERVAGELGVGFLSHDTRSEEDWIQVLDEVIARYGRLDILVNNAGIDASCPIDETTLEEWQKVIDVNLTGVFLGCKHGVRQMKQNPNRGTGSIINMASVAGLLGHRRGASYNASKGGVRLLTKAVAVETAHLGIRCNSIHPGVIHTPIVDNLLENAPDAAASIAYVKDVVPVGYMGDPARDVGNLAVYLGSDESVYVTGSEMVVDGGLSSSLPWK